MASNTLVTAVAFIEIPSSTGNQAILSTGPSRMPPKDQILHAAFFSVTSFQKSMRKIFPLLPIVIRVLTPNDIMDV